ncbi:hypothetical protein FGO68_gene1294 [Halteria grandinella]|uniref:Uncharacterized protein n=1 Tax=Halteria grandinella TaxID=5974 RepID=A0A8J8NVK9_HALGN|nr:hypothetical protein FGO68_gene1294 [Halteria grandinella]
MPLLALNPRLREWSFRTESELVFFLKVLADDEKSIQEHQGKNSGTATYHRQVQDLLYIDLPASRKYFPVTYQMYFKIFEKRSLIYTYHILKRLVLAAQKNGQPTHFRRSIKQLTIEFDHSSYQSQLNSQSDMEQVANFNEFLNTKLSRQTEIRLIIDDIITEPCQDDEEESKRGPILSFLLPNACNHLTLNRVKCNFPKSNKKDLKKLFRFAKDIKILRFADLRTDSVRNLMKVVMGTDKHIDTLVLDLNEKHCGEPEDMELSNILFNLKPHKVSNLFINYIYITQKTEMDTLKLMLRQINLLSDFEGKTTQIRIGECKHQIKFLEVLILEQK